MKPNIRCELCKHFTLKKPAAKKQSVQDLTYKGWCKELGCGTDRDLCRCGEDNFEKRLTVFEKYKNPSFAPYGTYEGERGNPEQWKFAFGARFSEREIGEIIGNDDPWGILGVRPGATQEEISTAFRGKAMETHPDRNPGKDGSEFRRVKAAYDKLRT